MNMFKPLSIRSENGANMISISKQHPIISILLLIPLKSIIL